MPRISGRSGRVFDLPMRPRPSARSVPRCFGFDADGRADLGDLERALASHHGTSTGSGCGPRSGLAVGVEHALGHELLGVEAPQAGDLVGPLQALEAGDGGVGDVDVVRRAERLAEHVVDAGLLEDGAGGATGDHAGTGGGRLEQHAAGAASRR